MAKTKPNEEVVESAEAVAEETVAENTTASSKPKKEKTIEDTALEAGKVAVNWQGQSRVYSREVHGENFVDLAKEFAGKKGGELTVA